jgi:hypothetical protein
MSSLFDTETKALASSASGKHRLVGDDLNKFWLVIITVFISAVAIATYKPTLFNFFILDDFPDIVWIESALRNITILIEQFHQPWMGELNHYRPFINSVYVLEYFLWGANGFYFRLISIGGLLASSLVVGLIAFELSRWCNRGVYQFSRNVSWAALSSALFAFYPLHCEPVNWCICQHDIFATFFCLLSFWSYIRWRVSSHNFFLFISLLSMIIAILCKETGVVLPLILLCYELLFHNTLTAGTKKSYLLSRVTMAAENIRVTLPYWLVLGGYFCARKAALGVFIESNAASHCCPKAEVLKIWLGSIFRICMPMDVSIISQDSPIRILWATILLLALCLSFRALKGRTGRNLRRFLLIWFVLSLLPTCSVFNISNLLGGSRYAYLSTAPLCLFLTYGIAKLSFASKHKGIVRAIGGTLVVMSLFILYCNNKSFAAAGMTYNKIIKALNNYYRFVPGDPPVRLLNLPTGPTPLIMSGMTKKPFLERDIFNCDAFYPNDQSTPFACLRALIEKRGNGISCLYWDSQSESLKPVCFYSMPANSPKSWKGEQLRKVVQVDGKEVNLTSEFLWERNDVLHIISKRPSLVTVNLAGFPCWAIDFIKFKLIVTPCSKPLRPVALRFLNDTTPSYSHRDFRSWNAILHAEARPDGKEQDVIFPLRNMPQWALGGRCHGLKLILPANSDIRLIAVSIPEAKTVIPLATASAEIRLTNEHNNQTINFDASHVNDCDHIVLEVVGPGQDFEKLYADKPESKAVFEISARQKKGVLAINRELFPENGQYKARMRALDKNGHQVGLAGDHFIIHVEEGGN